MNTFFNTVSWASYTGFLAFAIIIYYLFICLRCYRAEITSLFQRGSFKPAPKDRTNPFLALEQETAGDNERQRNIYQHIEGPEGSLETETLIAALRAQIAESSEQPYQPAAVPPKLKAIIRKYSDLKNSPRRAAINDLIVSECEKTGIALLTEEEVDQWWSD